jgi:hypothetical protein
MAYLVDSLTKASTGNRTAPDWWHDLKRAENQKHEMSAESEELFAKLRAEVFGAGAAVVDMPTTLSSSSKIPRLAAVLQSK